MTKQDFRKKLIELRNFFTEDFHRTQEFILFRPEEKGAVRNLEKVLLDKFDISGKATCLAIASAFLLEEIEKQEGEKSNE